MPDDAKPRVILGLMGLGPEGSPGARMTSLEDFRQALDIFQARGHRELDTARLYIGGQQEAFTRAAGWRERGLAIATKVYPITPGLHAPERLTEQFETSLRELGTDCVDIFYLHAPDRATPFAATLRACDALYRAGKFRRLGLSNYTAFEVAEICGTCARHGWVRPTVYQALYHVLFRGAEDELLPACRRYGLAVEAYSPTGGGFLAGRARSAGDDPPPEGRYAARSPMQQHLTRGKYFRDGVAAEAAGLPPLGVALRWLVHHSALRAGEDDGDGVVVGFANLRQLADNLDALEKGPLPQALLPALDRARRLARADEGPYWQMPMRYGYDTLEYLYGEGSA
ncbi:aflatoxin B1 aldehyde reductase member 2 [Xylariomycetidae sp. FL0641]|nr:aflatoxin B1 aldehyde reductase member 2 [Xylariomycetidae sp. FL0641]